MKLIIAGSRDIPFDDAWDLVWSYLYDNKLWPSIKEIVSGGCRGVDEVAEMLAFNYDYPFKVFNADWDKHGKSAGPIRNKQMAEYGNELIVVWDGKSRGTKSMINEMKKLNKPVHIIKWEPEC